uniref:Uncharacterized protein n=1 Tax=Leersia perrieri TaxID=77586 RepID=A0A0D9XKK4_9ORYZ
MAPASCPKCAGFREGDNRSGIRGGRRAGLRRRARHGAATMPAATGAERAGDERGGGGEHGVGGGLTTMPKSSNGGDSDNANWLGINDMS